MDGQVVTLPSSASLTIRADGTFDYDPAGAFDALGDGKFVSETFIYTLSDGQGADRIRGGGADDTLVGGKDDDTLIGGAGDDVFQFARNDGSDTIRRFQQDADLIQITSEGIGFDDLLIVQQGANVAISIGVTDVLLTAQSASDFYADDFILFA